jgi:hypothetical protein
MRKVYLAGLLGVGLLPLAATAQQLEAAGGSAGFGLHQTQARPGQLEVARFSIDTQSDRARGDDTGNRYAGFARVGFGAKGFFVQPELAYTRGLGNQYHIVDYSRVTPDHRIPDE